MGRLVNGVFAPDHDAVEVEYLQCREREELAHAMTSPTSSNRVTSNPKPWSGSGA